MSGTRKMREEVISTLHYAFGAGDDPDEIRYVYVPHVGDMAIDADTARRLAAIIDRGHCHISETSPGWWECSACGTTLDWDSSDIEPPNCDYCPGCGAEVVVDE